uniref:Thaumatin-like protein 6 n=1 Tax=Moniliophthora perniciosa TaxID=153609 RepID=A0A0K2FGC7_MONPR|nr:thaumatin-like protein 6 [Moniliophthora perniciosa]
MKGLFALVPIALASTVIARTFTVRNNCAFTVWPGLFTDPNVGPARPDQLTGWEAAPGTQVSFSVPNDWKAGRIWGRKECDFATNPGPTSCVSGGCNGGLECDPNTGTGVPPASIAEWTLQGDGNLDYYDVSLVDGFNIPMAITNNVDCPVADCPVDLTATCPGELASAAGCASACFANLDGNQQDSANCCSGSHSTPDTCPPDGVQFYDFFKGACPNSYAYAYDERSDTALWTCDSSLNADYTLTFCP